MHDVPSGTDFVRIMRIYQKFTVKNFMAVTVAFRNSSNGRMIAVGPFRDDRRLQRFYYLNDAWQSEATLGVHGLQFSGHDDYYAKIERAGDVVTISFSWDGIVWTPVQTTFDVTTDNSMSDVDEVGLMVQSTSAIATDVLEMQLLGYDTEQQAPATAGSGGGAVTGGDAMGFASWTQVADGDFTAQNAGSPTTNAFDTDHWDIVTVGDQATAFAKHSVSGDFDKVIVLSTTRPVSGNAANGVFFGDSGNGQKTCVFLSNSNGYFLCQHFSGAAYQANGPAIATGRVAAKYANRAYWRITRVGSVVTVSISHDGLDWELLLTLTATESGISTLDEVGVYHECNSVAAGVTNRTRVLGIDDGPQPEATAGSGSGSGGGASAFTGLTDTPESLGTAGQLVGVNEAGDALEFVDGPTAGEKVPTGGTTGQILAKASDTDLDTEWIDAPAGGSLVPATYPHWRIRFTTAGGFNGGVLGYMEMRGEVDGDQLATGGTASGGSSLNGTNTPDKAFIVGNGDANCWIGASGAVAAGTSWVAYEFAEPVWIAEYTLQTRDPPDGGQMASAWSLEYSEDGETWTEIDTETGETGWVNNETRTFTNSGEQPMVAGAGGGTVSNLNDVEDVSLDPAAIGSGDVGRAIGLINDSPITYGLLERLTATPVGGGVDIIAANDFATNSAAELSFPNTHLYDEIYIVGWGLTGSGSASGLLQLRADGINPSPTDLERMVHADGGITVEAQTSQDDFFICSGGFGDGLTFVAHIKGTKAGIPCHMTKTAGVKNRSYYQSETVIAKSLAEIKALVFLSEVSVTSGVIYAVGIKNSAQPLLASMDYTGSPGGAGTLARHVLPMAATIRIGPAGQFKVTTNPTTETVIEVRQDGVAIGDITIPATTGDPVLDITADTDLDAGDVLTLHATASGDFVDLYGSLLMEGRE
jgi:hypothetical protein